MTKKMKEFRSELTLQHQHIQCLNGLNEDKTFSKYIHKRKYDVKSHDE